MVMIGECVMAGAMLANTLLDFKYRETNTLLYAIAMVIGGVLVMHTWLGFVFAALILIFNFDAKHVGGGDFDAVMLTFLRFGIGDTLLIILIACLLSTFYGLGVGKKDIPFAGFMGIGYILILGVYFLF